MDKYIEEQEKDYIHGEEKHKKDLGGTMKEQIMIVDDDMNIGNMLEELPV